MDYKFRIVTINKILIMSDKDEMSIMKNISIINDKDNILIIKSRDKMVAI